MRIDSIRLFQAIKDYLTVYLPKQRNVSENTVKSYRETLNQFLGACLDT